jgi:hypothetical protein
VPPTKTGGPLVADALLICSDRNDAEGARTQHQELRDGEGLPRSQTRIGQPTIGRVEGR